LSFQPRNVAKTPIFHKFSLSQDTNREGAGLACNEEEIQVANTELPAQSGGSEHKLALVFPDSSVIIAYRRGESSSAQLFSAVAEGRIHFAVNPPRTLRAACSRSARVLCFRSPFQCPVPRTAYQHGSWCQW
jgi:hypothetical protein